MRKETILLLGLFLFLSCTEKIPIRPEYSGKTGWTPQITLVENNYRRFELKLWPNPEIPLEVQRNISYFRIEFRQAGSIDSETDFQIAGRVNTERSLGIPQYYTSGPVLTQDFNYTARVEVIYRDSTSRTSNEVSFASPHVFGKVLKRIVIPDDTTLYPQWVIYSPQTRPNYHPGVIGFEDGFIYAVQEDYLTRIDTASGNIELLSDNFYPSAEITDFAVKNNYVFLPEYYNYPSLALKKIDLSTLQVECTFYVDPPDMNVFWQPRIIANTGQFLYLMWQTSYSKCQIVKLDAADGELLETFPEFNSGFYWVENTFAYDGSDFWISQYQYFDYSIEKFAPASGPTGQDISQVPVFDPRGLAWDGAHFWVFEPGTRSFVKIGLEAF